MTPFTARISTARYVALCEDRQQQPSPARIGQLITRLARQHEAKPVNALLLDARRGHLFD